MTVDFSDTEATNYEIELSCYDTDYYWDTTYTYDGSQDVVSWTIPAITGPAQDCQLVVADSATYGLNGWDSLYFDVAAPPKPALVLDRVSQSRETFYPRVRDGYRDQTRTHFRINQRATVTVAVTNSAGATIRRAKLGSLRAGTHGWTWNGRRNSGALAKVGKYHVRLTATADQTRHAATVVKVASGWRTKSGDTTREGWNFSGADTAGNCFINDGFDDVTEELDCWGGKHAIVRYRLKLPANAWAIEWHVDGHRATDDFCCRGVIDRFGKRLDDRHYLIEVKVTGWRAYDVRFAYVDYKYKVRI